jgi:hypothetical protein
VPLSLGSIKATTTLNNLHINVGYDHRPVGSGDSFPDLWTPKSVTSTVDYTGIPGNLQPPDIDNSGTTLINDLALQHQQSTASYAELENSSKDSLIGAVSSFFDDAQIDGSVLKEKKIYHVNHNIGAFGVGSPFNDCGGSNTTNYYCYNAPEKVFSNGECISKFPGPKSFDRYLLSDPWEDYLSIWESRRCCHQQPGCACPDGPSDSFGFGSHWANANVGGGGLGGPGAGHIQGWGSAALALRFGVTDNSFAGYKMFFNAEAADPRHNSSASSTNTCEYYVYAGDSEFGLYPKLGWGIGNGGAYTVDNERILNGINLETIDCCFLPASTPCPIWFARFDISFQEWGAFFNAGAYNWNTDNVSPGGTVTYRWAGSVNGQAIDVSTTESADTGGFGEVQLYVNKQSDGNHSIYMRCFFKGVYIAPRIIQEGDVVCNTIYQRPNFEDPSIPQTPICRTMTSNDHNMYADINDLTTGCGYNPNLGDSATDYLAVPQSVYVAEEWTPWQEIKCDQVSNTFSFGGDTGFISATFKFKGDCFMSFLYEGYEGDAFPDVNEVKMNSNCLMGPKKVYP